MKSINLSARNIKKQYKFYYIYIISITTVMTLFYIAISFGQNAIIFEKIMGNEKLKAMLYIMIPLLMIFVIFYMAFSNNFFLKGRVRELGIYALLGFNRRKISKILFYENLSICLLSLCISIVLGSLLLRFIIFIIINIFKLTLNTSELTYFNMYAILVTAAFIIACMLTLQVVNFKFIGSTSLLDLVKSENKKEKNLHINYWKSIAGAVFLLLGYILALDIKRGINSLWSTIGFAPIAICVFLLVMLGTILSIQFFVPFTLKKIKNNKAIRYDKLNIVLISQFVHKITTNAKTLIISTLISAVALSLLCVGVITFYYPIKAIERINPSVVEFPLNSSNANSKKAIDILNKNNIKMVQTTVLQMTSRSSNLPDEYLKQKHFDVISLSEYNKVVKEVGKTPIKKLKKDHAIYIKYTNSKNNNILNKKYIIDEADHKIKVIMTSLNNSLSFNNSIATLVVSDETFKKYKLKTTVKRNIISVPRESVKLKNVHSELEKLFKNEPHFQSSITRKSEFIKDNSPTLLITVFSSIIFLIATGSIMYFTNLTNILSSKKDFRTMKLLGYKNKELDNIVSKHIIISMSIPFILGCLHSLVALECFKALMPNLVEGVVFLTAELFGIVIFLTIYTFYYVITKISASKIIK